MKRITIPLFLIILLVTSLALAKVTVVILSGSSGSVTSQYYCTGATTCNSPPTECDTLCEDFEGTTYCNYWGSNDPYCRISWHIDNSSGATFTWNATNPDSSYCPNTISSNSLKVSLTANGASAYARSDFASSIDPTYLQFYLTIDSEVLDNGEQATVLTLTDSGGNEYPGSIRIFQNASGDLVLRLFYYATSFTSADGTTPLNLDTAYRVNVKWDGTNNTIVVKLDGSTEISVTDYGGSSTARIYLGPKGVYDGDGNMAYYIDNIAIDSSGEPVQCN